MVRSNLWAAGLAAAVIGAGLVALGAYDLWLAAEVGQQITIVGAVLNLAPTALLGAAGVALLLRPRRDTLAFWLAPLSAPLLAGGWVVATSGAGNPYFVAFAAAVVAYLVLIVMGRRLRAQLRQSGARGVLAATMAGGAIGLLLMYLWALLIVALNYGFADLSPFALAIVPALLLPGAVIGGAVTGAYATVAGAARARESAWAMFS